MTNPLGAAGSIFGKLLSLYRREPAATQTAIAVMYAAWLAVDNAVIKHVGVLNWQLILAGGIALYGLLIRAQVIPTVKAKAQLAAGFRQAMSRPPIVLPEPPVVTPDP